MRALFVHDPNVHSAHAAWAQSIGARFVNCNPQTMPAMVRPAQAALQARSLRRYDAILAEGGTCLPLAVRAKKSGAKLIMISADALFYEWEKQGPVRKRYMAKLLKRVDGIIAVSSLAKEYAEKRIDAPVAVVHPYADVDKFSKIKAKLDSKRIIFIGKHRPDKNIEGLVEEFKKIRREVPEATLTLIGGLIEERMPFASRIDGVAVAGRLSFGAMRQHIASSRIFMHIARYDPCPVVVTEMLAAGLPPLISEGIGSRDFVPKQLVAQENYAERAVELLTCPRQRITKLSKQCRAAAAGHTKKKSQAAFRAAFRELVA